MIRLCSVLRREAVLPALFEHALREHPRECCGLIHQSGAVRRCRNAIDDWRQTETAGFDRTSANGYALGFDDMAFLIDSFDGPDPVRTVYHSHPDGSRGFSAADRAIASPEGTPIYPQLSHLVIGCTGRIVTGATLYSFENGAFRAVAEFEGEGMNGG